MKRTKSSVAIAAPVGVVAMCIASASVLAQVSESQYRADQPATLNGAAERRAAADAERATVAADFKAAYARAGKPKIALFWHRQLDDSVSSTREASAHITSQGALPEHNYDATIKIESKAGASQAYSLAPPPRAAEFEAGFQSALRAAGVQFVDRNTIVRLSALSSTQDGQNAKDLDSQTVEMSALSEYAEYFAAVNFIADPAAQGGLQVRVSVISTRTGVVIADVVPTDLYDPDREPQPDSEPAHWRAGESGFKKIEKRKNGGHEGREVAHALMEQMVSQLSNR